MHRVGVKSPPETFIDFLYLASETFSRVVSCAARSSRWWNALPHMRIDRPPCLARFGSIREARRLCPSCLGALMSFERLITSVKCVPGCLKLHDLGVSGRASSWLPCRWVPVTAGIAPRSRSLLEIVLRYPSTRRLLLIQGLLRPTFGVRFD